MGSTDPIRVRPGTAGRLIVLFRYRVDRVAKIKTVTGRRWHPEESCWTVPHTEGAIARLLDQATLDTNGNAHTLTIAPKATGFGSSANGGELLFLALATCYCNDIYREAAKRGLSVSNVTVEVEGDFGAEGEPARNVTYRAKVTAQASEDAIRELMQQADRLAEIQNTLRVGTPVTLSQAEAVTK